MQIRGLPRRARAAVALTFAANGLLIGSWAPRIPEVKDDLGLSPGALGIALLGPALGTVLVARIVGHRTAVHGSAAVTRALTVLYCLAAGLPGLAGNLPTLVITLLLWGATMGAMDVGMNAQAVTVEQAYGRPVMASFHAAWSLGTFTGALLGGIGVALDAHIALQQWVIGAAAAAMLVGLQRDFLADPPHELAPRPRGLRVPRLPSARLVLLGLSAIFAFVAEGAVADWSGVYARDHLDVSGSMVSAGYVAFCVLMVAGRMAGDRVVHRLGRVRCIAGCAVLGAAGIAAGLAGNGLPYAVGGFALLGLGLSIIVPVLFSTAADTDGPSGPAIAAVSALGCLGLLGGPSLIGLVGNLTSVATALWLLPPFTIAAGALGVLGVRMTRRTRRRSVDDQLEVDRTVAREGDATVAVHQLEADEAET